MANSANRDDITTMLTRLVSSNALSAGQAWRLSESWLELDNDGWSHPELRSVREHTRAYVEAYPRAASQSPKTEECITCSSSSGTV
jgi:hypothetical protein